MVSITKGIVPATFKTDNKDENSHCFFCKSFGITRLVGGNRYIVGCKKHNLIFDYRNNLTEFERTVCSNYEETEFE